MFIRMCHGLACRNVAVSSSQTRNLWKMSSLLAAKASSNAGPRNFWAMKTATLIRMIALQAGATPESHPEPRVLSR